jgi:hypothetical protein
MRIEEIANASDLLGLWKLISDNTWSAIQQQAAQEARDKAEKAAAAKSQRFKRGGGRKSVSKSTATVATPSPSTVKPAPTKTSNAQAADAAVTQSSKPVQQVQAPQAQGPLPRTGALQAVKPLANQSALSAQIPINVALPKTPTTSVLPAQKTVPKLSARHGGLVADSTAK